jgi:hypothetical protein
MYAFRKPYTVDSYEDLELWGIGYKVLLIFFQVGGYASAKLLGIKYVSELPHGRRARTIVVLIAAAHLSLLLYAVAPLWLKPCCLFCNGLGLGMVFGCVLSNLEGRRTTELMAAGLCASFIMSSGTVKTAGALLLRDFDVPLFWMPFVTGALFWAPLVLGVWMLAQIPPPSAADMSSRAQREPLDGPGRKRFFRRYRFGLSLLVAMVVLLTIVRSFRDDDAKEIWTGLGFDRPEIFATTEVLVAGLSLGLSGLAILVRSNRGAFQAAMLIGSVGFATALATSAYYWSTTEWSESGALCFMILLGVGFYVPYVLFHTTIFERLLATLRDKGNIGYLMYLSDFAGYLSTVLMMVIMHLVSEQGVDFVALLLWLAMIASPLCLLCTALVMVYFGHRRRTGVHAAL